MSSKPFLNEALQIGPWRVKRKHLLFIIAFSFFVVVFGIVVLQTHIFDTSRDDSEEDDDDDDDDEDSGSGDKYGSGDWLMMIIITISGILAIAAAVVCFFAKQNSPRQMTSADPQSVYAVQYNKDTKTPINSIPRASYTAPQPISLLAGHIVQQIQAQQKAAQTSGSVANTQEPQTQQQPPQQQIQQMLQQQQAPQQQAQQMGQQQRQHPQPSSQQPVQRTANIDTARIQITANPSAPNQITVELPPPYSP